MWHCVRLLHWGEVLHSGKNWNVLDTPEIMFLVLSKLPETLEKSGTGMS